MSVPQRPEAVTLIRTWSPVSSGLEVWDFLIEPSFEPLKTVKEGMILFVDILSCEGEGLAVVTREVK